MGQSLSAYLKTAKGVRSVRQIHAVTTAICEDPHASQHLKRTSSALTRKLEQIINLPIANAPFLASIWRDFRALNALLEKENGKLNLIATHIEAPSIDRVLPVKEEALAEEPALKCDGKTAMGNSLIEH